MAFSLKRERKGSSQVHAVFLFEQSAFFLFMVFVGNTAIYRAYGSTLRFIMETGALGAFIGSNVINIHAIRLQRLFCICCDAGIASFVFSFDLGTVGKTPFGAAFVDGIIRAFWFAGAAINAFIRDFYSHFLVSFACW